MVVGEVIAEQRNILTLPECRAFYICPVVWELIVLYGCCVGKMGYLGYRPRTDTTFMNYKHLTIELEQLAETRLSSGISERCYQVSG